MTQGFAHARPGVQRDEVKTMFVELSKVRRVVRLGCHVASAALLIACSDTGVSDDDATGGLGGSGASGGGGSPSAGSGSPSAGGGSTAQGGSTASGGAGAAGRGGAAGAAGSSAG